jgi:hypothetical protein
MASSSGSSLTLSALLEKECATRTRVKGFRPTEGLSRKKAPFATDIDANAIRVLCVKFCKGGHGWLESCGLAELDFLVLFEIVHIEIAVGFEPVLVGFDG